MNTTFRKCGMPVLLLTLAALGGCASQGKRPPEIKLDEPQEAQRQLDPAHPIEVVEVPQPLPLPAQLKPLPAQSASRQALEPADDKARVSRANEDARVAPTREGYINAIQVWPFAEGALYQVYTSPGRVTAIALQEGEELVTVSAGDTVRWVVGDTTSGSGASQRISVLVKPTRTGLKTNMVISTNRRTYLLELSSTPQTWMASVSWDYPKDRMLALQKRAHEAQASAPVEICPTPGRSRFRYAITGDSPAWKPLRAFDDGQRVCIQFPAAIAQTELPPLFVIGAQGDAQLVNYRFRAPYYVVDRLFGAAELRLGGAAELRLGGGKGQVVRIERTDGVAANGQGQ